MADEKLVPILKQGADAWNDWRGTNPRKIIDLIGANLSRAELRDANLSQAYLSGADLSGVNKCV